MTQFNKKTIESNTPAWNECLINSFTLRDTSGKILVLHPSITASHWVRWTIQTNRLSEMNENNDCFRGKGLVTEITYMPNIFFWVSSELGGAATLKISSGYCTWFPSRVEPTLGEQRFLLLAWLMQCLESWNWQSNATRGRGNILKYRINK